MLEYFGANETPLLQALRERPRKRQKTVQRHFCHLERGTRKGRRSTFAFASAGCRFTHAKGLKRILLLACFIASPPSTRRATGTTVPRLTLYTEENFRVRYRKLNKQTTPHVSFFHLPTPLPLVFFSSQFDLRDRPDQFESKARSIHLQWYIKSNTHRTTK